MISLVLAAFAAEVPLTYEQVRTDALLSNPKVQRAQLDIDAATSGVRSALGFLDRKNTKKLFQSVVGYGEWKIPDMNLPISQFGRCCGGLPVWRWV